MKSEKTVTTIPVVVGTAYEGDVKNLLNPDVLEANIKFLDDITEILVNVRNGIGMDLDADFFAEVAELRSTLRKVYQGRVEGEEYKSEP